MTQFLSEEGCKNRHYKPGTSSAWGKRIFQLGKEKREISLVNSIKLQIEGEEREWTASNDLYTKVTQDIYCAYYRLKKS